MSKNVTTRDDKISYVKPEILDLGDVTALCGDTCDSGSGDTLCDGGSWNAGSSCTDGTNAGANCNKGSARGILVPT